MAAVLADAGLRPDECHRLRWEDITWANGRNGTMLVNQGKTAAARRVLPMTEPRTEETPEKSGEYLVSAAGLEPATHALKGHCSTN